MNKSVEAPFADDPLTGDPLLMELREARPEAPDSLVDPHAPANQLILETILDGTTGRRRTRRTPRKALLRVAAVATLGAIVAGLLVASPFGGTEPSAADVVRRAAAASEEALDSGRASLTVTQEGEDGSTEDTYEYRFAGEDVGVKILLGSDGEGYAGERRIVDGELYWHVGDDASTPWFHQTGIGPSRSDWTGDPRSLLAGLEPGAGFEIVGDDDIDGFEVTHLQATTPGNVDASGLSLGEATMSEGTLTGLDVWVDGDGVVRRIDLEMTNTFDVMVSEVAGEPMEARTLTQTVTASVRFSDIGVPNSIQAPTNVCDVSVEQMENPPPPGTDVC